MNVVEQQREDAALGAAWRRCEAALPEGWQIGVMNSLPHSAWAYVVGEEIVEGEGPSPTAALTALAEALERKAAE